MNNSAAFFAKVRKVVALVGSDREGERHAAADQAYRMCGDNNLSVTEALATAFGNDGGTDDLRRQIEELEDDNRKLAEAVNVLNAQAQAVPADAGKRMLQAFWSYPQVRLIVALVVASGYFWALPEICGWFNLRRNWVQGFEGAYAVGMLAVLWRWACAEFSRSGAGVVTIKAIAIVATLSLTLGFGPDTEGEACALIGIIGLVTVTNGANWLAGQFAHSNSEIFSTLRSWFA